MYTTNGERKLAEEIRRLKIELGQPTYNEWTVYIKKGLYYSTECTRTSEEAAQAEVEAFKSHGVDAYYQITY